MFEGKKQAKKELVTQIILKNKDYALLPSINILINLKIASPYYATLEALQMVAL